MILILPVFCHREAVADFVQLDEGGSACLFHKLSNRAQLTHLIPVAMKHHPVEIIPLSCRTKYIVRQLAMLLS